MKNFKLSFALAASVLLPQSCDLSLAGPESNKGILKICFDAVPSKSALTLPDTNDFILSVRDASGKPVYSGKFGSCPECLSVEAGSYSVSARSCEFDEPAFDCPLYGDEQLVVVPAGGMVKARLSCSQINSGIRFSIDPTFRTRFPSGVLYLNSSEGKLMYGYSETRTAYFNPGTVSLELENGGSSSILLTRNLQARKILSIKLCADMSADSGIDLQVDTTRNWEADEYIWGGGKEGEDIISALSVPKTADHIGGQNLWVYGYVVGVSVSTSKSEYEAPFSSNTNILLCSRAAVSSREDCISVELPKGDLRDALNLKDNPDNIGRMVYLRGNIVDSYYGLRGLKSVTEFKWK